MVCSLIPLPLPRPLHTPKKSFNRVTRFYKCLKFGYFKKPIVLFVDVKKHKVIGTFWAFICLSIVFTFSPISVSIFVASILSFQKGFDVDVFGFEIELRCKYFGIFWLGNCFSYFSRKLGEIFSNLLVILVLNTQHYDIQHNDTQYNDIQRNDIKQNDTVHNDTHQNNSKHNDIQQNDNKQA
jgi:hypothetical protein